MFMQTFLDHFPGTGFIKDSHSKFLRVNKYFTDIFGAEENLIGKEPGKLFSEEFAQRIIEEDKKTLQKGNNIFEKIIQHDGSESTFEVHSFRIDRENKEPLIGGIAIDITDWYRSKQARRESEERYRVVFQNTGTATIIVDFDMTIILANNGFERLSGFSSEEILFVVAV